MALLAVASIKQGPPSTPPLDSNLTLPPPTNLQNQKTSHDLLLTLEVSVASGYPFSRLSDRLMAWIMPFFPPSLPFEAGGSRPSWPPGFPVVIALLSLLGTRQSLLPAPDPSPPSSFLDVLSVPARVHCCHRPDSLIL